MGMAATSYNLFLCLSRKANYTTELSLAAMTKNSLVRESEKITEEYNNAVNSQKFMFSSNNGITYSDINYTNLMKPNSINKNKPYLITDKNDKVVLDSYYKTYAEMISPNGEAGGDWENNRSQILSNILGLEPEVFDLETEYNNSIYRCKTTLEELKNNEPRDYIQKTSIEEFLNAVGLNPSSSIADLKSKSSYLPNKEAFEEACDIISSNQNGGSLIEQVFGAYQSKGGSLITEDDECTTLIWYDISSPEYQEWLDWKSQYTIAEEEYKNATNNRNMLITTEQRSLIEFYDNLFSSIAELGWTYNSQINDDEYLNEMLMNNMYNITTVDRSANYEDSELNWLNSYNTNIATNTENLFKVNNTDKERKAATIRDHKKSLLQKKENIIDLKMQKLNTEISVLNTMIQGLKTVKNDNITRTFGGSA